MGKNGTTKPHIFLLVLISHVNDFHKGLKVVNEEYHAYDQYLESFYWSEDILTFKDRLYKSGGVIQVVPLVKKKELTF